MSALVSPEQLLSDLGDTPPLLLDVRWTLAGRDRAAYLAGHLPGAVFCDLDADLAAPPGAGGRHPLPSRDELAGAMERLGVRPGRRVVVYDGGVAAAAARAWWCLRWLGHEDVRVLDGGLPAWVAAGGQLEAGGTTTAGDQPAREVTTTAGDGAAQAAAPSSSMPTVTAEDLLPYDGVLLDARAAERFRGEVEPVDPVAGHVPGARSLPTSRLLDADGRYLSPAELRDLLAAAGTDTGRPLAAYCGSGVTAAQLVLAAHEAGLDAALYPGSWSHWITDPARPVATGTD
ncbi:thiosulfate/3-mercaptopyruvate sulfurtransferase [Georgenia satyanarayanai]|uniref:Thiosulfate/3-mercaptopyruvate sulfurtransferase n=1 Tax=Georgenia satyanarayanai TaxID=860221 RepID=A0A2Y8ZW66_9MICO|nr:sulfurtransferase [Georgenia satyanarayanai]PYG01810.1 thiosulfate/3-mercaptopyruvate sulfurtransferase [Georgenia satyanarayanai]SSA36610.1 thiosulfate/3-mercaptopyruvate sulfurtransferase [Georgenia satyanarayanai]